jgi:hypothetical protein
MFIVKRCPRLGPLQCRPKYLGHVRPRQFPDRRPLRIGNLRFTPIGRETTHSPLGGDELSECLELPLPKLATLRAGSQTESLNRPLGIPDMALKGGGGVLAQIVVS